MNESGNDFVEHRRFLRLYTNDIGHLICTIQVSPDKAVELETTDISPGGFGAVIPEYQLSNFHKGSEFPHCQFNLPGLDDISVRLVNIWMLKRKDGESKMIGGFEFTSDLNWLSTGLESCAMPD